VFLEAINIYKADIFNALHGRTFH